MSCMVKEIMGRNSTMEAAFRCDYLRESSKSHVKRCRTSHHRYKKVSMVPTFSELKTAALQQSDSAAPLEPFAKEGPNLGMEPVTCTISGTVTIKNGMATEEEMMTTMLQHFDTLHESGMVMQLVSNEIDPRTMEPKLSKPAVLEWLKQLKVGDERSTHKIEFEIDSNFGFPGAIIVTNKYDKEIFLEGFSIEGVLDITCNSWVKPETVQQKRVFFSNKARLPCHTPAGLKELRKEEMRQLRGNGKGVRRGCERIYDYDVYNDLGNPDKGNEYVRPILGTKEYPSPRRCRTGRPPALTDIKSESPKDASMETYVPRDEVFNGARKEAFDVESKKGMIRNLIPFISTFVTKCGAFKQLSDVEKIYKTKHVQEMKPKDENTTWSFPMEDYFKFNTPHIIRGNPLRNLGVRHWLV